jgi:hypothetical protein
MPAPLVLFPLRRAVIVCSLLLPLGQWAQASPTSADFERCERIAAATLSACLAEPAAASAPHANRERLCRAQAARRKQACGGAVRESYDPARARERREAMQRAEAEVAARRAASAAAN